jgi:hypothetical protein
MFHATTRLSVTAINMQNPDWLNFVYNCKKSPKFREITDDDKMGLYAELNPILIHSFR